MTADSEVTVAEIARRCDVSIAAVSNWRARHADFPAASTGPGGEIFHTAEVLNWLRNRTIAANGLRPGETKGATYADRFVGSSGHDTANREPAAGKPQMRVPLDTTRDDPTLADIIVGLVALRLRAPETFADLRSEPAPDLATGIARVSDPRFSDVFPDLSRGAVRPAQLSRLVDRVATTTLPDPDDLVACGRLARELIDAGAVLRGRTGDHTTPTCLVELMVRATRAGSATRVHDPFARAGELLVGAAVSSATGADGVPVLSADTATDTSYRATRAASLLVGVDIDVRYRQMLARGGRANYDVVLSNPPFGLTGVELPAHDDRWRYGPPPRHNANFAWLQHILSLLDDDGRAAVLMANNAATSDNPTERAIRTAMVEAGVVTAVIALPDRLFASTSIAPSLWLLRSRPVGPVPDVLLIDATTLGHAQHGGRHLSEHDITMIVEACRQEGKDRRTRPEVPGLTTTVPASELAHSRAGLNPRAHVAPSEQRAAGGRASRFDRAERDRIALLTHVNELTKSTDERLPSLDRMQSAIERVATRTTTVGTMCSIQTGPGKFDEDDHGAPRSHVVQARSIQHHRISDPGAAVSISPAQTERYRLDEGDIVCVRVGQLGRHGLVRSHQAGWLLGPGCIRIRPAAGVDPRYLTYCLASDSAQDWIDRHSTGSAVRGLSARMLGEMPLILPPLEEQRRVGALLGALDDEAEALERTAAITAELRSAAVELLMSGPTVSAADTSGR